MLVRLIKKSAVSVIVVTFVFGVAGIALYYFVPQKFSAAGTFYVERSVENGAGRFFTYEGYYNQQTAIAYSNTVLGLLESDDVRTLALKKLGIDITEQSLRRFNRQIKTTKTANQLITLSVTATNPKKAESAFKALAQSTVDTSDKLSQTSDPFLHVALVNNQPVVQETFRNVWVNLSIGMLLGFLLSVLFLSFKSYLKEQA